MPEIQLSGKHGVDKIAIVDDDDYRKLSKFKWYVSHCGYVVRSKKGGDVIRMHREIMNPPAGKVVDHINFNKLDNRKTNLRVCTLAQNNMNKARYSQSKSGYKGVYPGNQTNRWTAAITNGNQTKHLGTFKSEVEAARAYDYYALKYLGDFANLNFPTENPIKPEREVIYSQNTTGYRGVYWNKSIQSWVSLIRHKKKSYYLGVFENKHDAARMYNFWAIDLIGSKAILNEIKEEVT